MMRIGSRQGSYTLITKPSSFNYRFLFLSLTFIAVPKLTHPSLWLQWLLRSEFFLSHTLNCRASFLGYSCHLSAHDIFKLDLLFNFSIKASLHQKRETIIYLSRPRKTQRCFSFIQKSPHWRQKGEFMRP